MFFLTNLITNIALFKNWLRKSFSQKKTDKFFSLAKKLPIKNNRATNFFLIVFVGFFEFFSIKYNQDLVKSCLRRFLHCTLSRAKFVQSWDPIALLLLVVFKNVNADQRDGVNSSRYQPT
jgi:hypothetical protein